MSVPAVERQRLNALITALAEQAKSIEAERLKEKQRREEAVMQQERDAALRALRAAMEEKLGKIDKLARRMKDAIEIETLLDFNDSVTKRESNFAIYCNCLEWSKWNQDKGPLLMDIRDKLRRLPESDLERLHKMAFA